MVKCENCGYENEDDCIVCKQCHYLLRDNDDKKEKDNTVNDTLDIIFRDVPEHHFNYDNGYFLIDSAQPVEVMDTPSTPKQNKSVLLACVLSFFLTGIGNIYAGLFKRGTIEFIISMIISSFVPINSQFVIDYNSYIFYIALIWEFYVIYDTYKCVKAVNENKEVPLFLGFMNLNK